GHLPYAVLLSIVPSAASLRSSRENVRKRRTQRNDRGRYVRLLPQCPAMKSPPHGVMLAKLLQGNTLRSRARCRRQRRVPSPRQPVNDFVGRDIASCALQYIIHEAGIIAADPLLSKQVSRGECATP